MKPTTPDHARLHEIEREFGFRYPAAFILALDKLIGLSRDSNFLSKFPETRLLLSVDEVANAYKDGVPGNLVPFMLAVEPKHIDYYCLSPRLSESDCPVVVFAVHAIVFEWEGFEAFLSWSCQRIR